MFDILSEQTRTGKRYKPNANNPVTISRDNLMQQVKRVASQNEVPLEIASLEFVKNSVPELQRYVVSRGEQPLRNPVELSVQVVALREQEINTIMNTLGMDRTSAELYLDEQESRKIASKGFSGDNFIGSIIGAVTTVAKKGITKIAADKKKKNKPGKFWSFLSETLNNGEQVDPMPDGGVKVYGEEVLNEIRNREKKSEIKKMLPYIVGGVLLIIVITFLIARNAKNK